MGSWNGLRQIRKATFTSTGDGMAISFPVTGAGIVVPGAEVAFCTAIRVSVFGFSHKV